MHLIKNSCSAYGTLIPRLYASTIDRNAPIEARKYFSALSTYQPTPLLSLTRLAKALGVGNILYKDEGHRLGLQSFKALGGAYAVARLVHKHAEEKTGGRIPVAELLNKIIKEHAKELTVACATDGNHGRSVAWGAQLLGCPCVIFLHENVSKTREDAIAAFGARIIRVPGVYDDSFVEAARVSKRNGWHIVSDFATEPYHEVTSYVMQGYSLMVDEIITDLEAQDEKLSHIFVQGGCGGLAAAVAGHFSTRLDEKPTIIVVEPDRANCLLQSAEKTVITQIEVSEPTCMTMLECYEPSHMAWPILERTVEFFMDIPDPIALEASHLLVAPIDGDPVIHAGVSGAAGLAGLLAAHKDREFMETLGLGEASNVLIIGSEGAIE